MRRNICSLHHLFTFHLDDMMTDPPDLSGQSAETVSFGCQKCLACLSLVGNDIHVRLSLPFRIWYLVPTSVLPHHTHMKRYRMHIRYSTSNYSGGSCVNIAPHSRGNVIHAALVRKIAETKLVVFMIVTRNISSIKECLTEMAMASSARRSSSIV